MNYDKYLTFSKIARKEEKAEKVFRNAKVLNVFTEEIVLADIAVHNGIIVGVSKKNIDGDNVDGDNDNSVNSNENNNENNSKNQKNNNENSSNNKGINEGNNGEYIAKEEIDLTGKYVVPGFVDSHLHLESTMVQPKIFLREAIKSGTTTFIVDPHEAANVSGNDGIDYILNQTENAIGNVYVMIPSCVPATNFEDSGAALFAEDMKKYIENERVLGLAEVMDARAIISGEETMMDKLELFKNKNIDGHAPALNDDELTAYALAGIKTDHEATDYVYAKKEIERGMYVLIREGSAAKNLESIVSGIVRENANTSRYCFCTDDKHIEDIRKEGHISHNIKKAIELGINPVKAYKMATIQGTECIGKGKTMGAVAPGYKADFVVLDDFEKVKINSVYFNGENVNTLFELEKKEEENKKESKKGNVNFIPEHLKQTVKIKDFNINKLSLKIKDENAEFPVLNTIPGQIVIEKLMELIPVKNGEFTPNKKYNKIAVIERHHNTGKIGLGILKGFGIENGAIASTVAHDSHNIVVVGDNDKDMEIAVNELVRVQGGYTIVENGKVVDTLPLVIMGLMSSQSYEEVNEKLKSMIEYSKKMGINENIDPFINLSFMALPVIPELRVTTRGIYDVLENKFY